MADIDHTRDCVLPSDGKAEGLVRASELFAVAAERDALRSENMRLRAALESIKDMTDYGTETATWRMTSAIHNVNVIARAALEAAHDR